MGQYENQANKATTSKIIEDQTKLKHSKLSKVWSKEEFF